MAPENITVPRFGRAALWAVLCDQEIADACDDDLPPDELSYLDAADAMIAAHWTALDGDAAGYTYVWYLNGIQIPGATGATLLSPLFNKGDLLAVEVTPFDGEDSGTPVMSPNRLVWNTPPTQPQVQIQPGTPDTSNDLLCGFAVLSTDLDGDTISYTFEWTRNGFTTANSTNTVPSSDTVLGDTWTCIVTPHDGEDAGTIAS